MTKGVRTGLSEDEIQITVLNWSMRQKYKGRPIYDYLHHSPNGGKRNVREATNFKRMGTKKGCPDLILDISRGPYHGLRIEIKKDKSSYPTREQKERIKTLNEEGYLAVVTKGLDETLDAIMNYIYELHKARRI